MLVKLETYKMETGEIVATDYIVTNSPMRAMEMINEADDENVRYHICDDDESRSFFASQMAQNKTEAQVEAARENGKKGGRPRRFYAGYNSWGTNFSYDGDGWSVHVFNSKTARDAWVEADDYPNGNPTRESISLKTAKVIQPNREHWIE